MKYLLRNLLVLLLLAAVPAAAFAQGGRRLNQLESAKIAYLTNKLALTQDQAQKFWPVYNEFVAKRRDVNRRLRQLRLSDAASLTDAQIKDNLTQALTLRQTEVNLEKEYFDKFQRVLSIRQVGQLFQAEREFTKEVLKRVAGRPGAGGAALPADADD